MTKSNRRMMLSFIPKVDLARVSAGKPFNKFIHRSFVQLDPATATASDVMLTAQQNLHAFFQKRSAYHEELPPSSSAVKIIAVWAGGSNDLGWERVAVPLTSCDYLLSDAVVGRTWESRFGSAPPPDDGMLFAVLPPDLTIDMLMTLDAAERSNVLAASQHLKRVWGSHIWFELPNSELFFEAATQ
jgi:hypothetical protein